MESQKTEYVDKSGRPIYVGDIVQHRMSGLQKSGGPSRFRVEQNKKGVVKLVSLSENNPVSIPLRKSYEEFLVVLESPIRKD